MSAPSGGRTDGGRTDGGQSGHVTLHVWRVSGARVPQVLWRLARDRARLRAVPGVRFAKLLGTGRGFGPAQADLDRWAAVVAWDDGRAAAGFDATAVARSWRSLARAYCRLDLAPVSSRGSWAGRRPFRPGPSPGLDTEVLALTRARLRPTRAAAFWRAVDPVAAAARTAPGLLAAFGIGEAPIGWQGTVSLWRTGRDLVEFAYRHPAHATVVSETPLRRWYAEELFARFAVLDIAGDRRVIGADDGRTEEGP